MSITKEQLEDHIKNGLISDIFKMERAYFLLKKISENVQTINEPNNGNYGELFGTLQHALETEAIMSIARLFDNPNTRYPTRCIRGLLSFIEEKADELPAIEQKYNLVQHLTKIGAPQNVISSLETDDKIFTLEFVAYYRAILERENIIESIGRLKTIRDKALAHNEMASALNGPTWGGLEELIGLSKDLAGVLGWAYMNTVYVHNGEYILTSDAERPSRALRRLFASVY